MSHQHNKKNVSNFCKNFIKFFPEKESFLNLTASQSPSTADASQILQEKYEFRESFPAATTVRNPPPSEPLEHLGAVATKASPLHRRIVHGKKDAGMAKKHGELCI